MTREHKLALIVGFSMVLLVGVLISDHWSRAAHAQVASTGPEQSAPVEAALREPTPPLKQIDEAPTPAVGVAPTPTPSDRVGVHEPSNGPLTIAQGVQRAGPDTQSPEHDPKLEEAIKTAGGQMIDTPNGRQVSLAPPGAKGNAIVDMVPPPSGTQPEAFRWHSVQAGETLFKIAQKYYGNGNAWRKLVEANADRVGPNGTVHAGVRLKIPGVAGAASGNDTEGRVAPPKPDAKPRPPSTRSVIAQTPPTPPGRPKAEPVARTYTVRHGDTLGAIAQKVLGSARRQQDLLQANPGVIDDEDTLEEGMVLKVPNV